MAMMVMYAGMDSLKSLKSMPATEVSMRKPTMTRAGAVAKAGMAMKNGDRKRDKAKRTATQTAVRPVRPPSLTPVALSTKVVVVLVPRTAPIVVATASARRAPLMRGRRPRSSSMLALDETPMSVPNVSKISTKRKANMTTRKSRLKTRLKSSWPRMGLRLAGAKAAAPPDRSGMTLNIFISGLGT